MSDPQTARARPDECVSIGVSPISKQEQQSTGCPIHKLRGPDQMHSPLRMRINWSESDIQARATVYFHFQSRSQSFEKWPLPSQDLFVCSPVHP